MSFILRILLITTSICTSFIILKRIQKSKLRIDDAIFWVLFSIALVILAIFPNILYFLSDITKVNSPVNLLFLIIIGILIMKIFSMSITISNLETKINTVIQNRALEKNKDL